MHHSGGEHTHTQGLPAAAVKWPNEVTAYALLGKSMARPVLQRLLHRVLRQWGLLRGPDPWERGEAQQQLRDDAAREGPPGGRRPDGSPAGGAGPDEGSVPLPASRAKAAPRVGQKQLPLAAFFHDRGDAADRRARAQPAQPGTTRQRGASAPVRDPRPAILAGLRLSRFTAALGAPRADPDTAMQPDPRGGARPPAFPNVGESCFLGAALHAVLAALHYQGLAEVTPLGGDGSSTAQAFAEVVADGLADRCKPVALRRLADCVRGALGGGPREGQHDALQCLELFLQLPALAAWGRLQWDQLTTCAAVAGCGGTVVQAQEACVWRLELPPDDGAPRRLEDLAAAHFAPCGAGPSGAWTCPACGERAPPIHQVGRARLPPVLCIQLMRFTPTSGGWGRSRLPVVVPRVPWRPTAAEELAEAGVGLWTLVAVVRHHGRVDSGHFTAEVVRHGRWWVCDDGRVEVARAARELEPDPDAYALVFRRVDAG